jgi:DNA primase
MGQPARLIVTTSTDFKDTLKQQADIVRVVGDYVRLKRAGAQNFSGLCPFHAEKTPSFSVHTTRQFYHCFGCGASGDVFTFVQKVENISFPEAVRVVAQKMGVPMPRVTFSSPQEAREAQHRTTLLEIHDLACEFFQRCLRRPEGALAREYLRGRGLDEETIKKFRIGYAPDSGFVLRDFLRKKFEEDMLRESGLFSWKQEDGHQSSVVGRQENSGRSASVSPQQADAGTSGGAQEEQIPPGLKLGRNDNPLGEPDSQARSGQLPSEAGGLELTAKSRQPTTDDQRPTAEDRPTIYSKFRNRVIFPICNDSGKIIAFTGRTLSADEKAGPKYLNSPETPVYSKSRILFNLDQAKEAIRQLNYAILVEGQMDCISVFASGFHNVIASSGTAFTDAQAKLLGRFSKNVVVNFDPDTAGARATERTLGLLVEEDFQVKVLRLEAGFDPDLYIRRKGKDAYADALGQSQRYFDYLIERARVQFAVRSPEGKVKAVNYLLPHVQRVPSRIVRDELAHEIAQKFGIDSSVMRQELKHVAGTRSAAVVKASAEVQITDAEKILIRALASGSEMQSTEEHHSAREGADEEFDPARQAQFVLQKEHLHQGLATESLIEVLLGLDGVCTDAMSLPLTDDDRRLLAAILMKEEEELTPERVDGAIKALRRKFIRRKQDGVQREIQSIGNKDPGRLLELLREKERLKRALMDPGLTDDGTGALAG